MRGPVFVIEEKVSHPDGDFYQLYGDPYPCHFYTSRRVAELDARSHFADDSEWRVIGLSLAHLESDLLRSMEE